MVLPLREVIVSWASDGIEKSTHAPDDSCMRRTVKVPKSRPCASESFERTSSSRDCSSSSLTSLESPPIQRLRAEEDPTC